MYNNILYIGVVYFTFCYMSAAYKDLVKDIQEYYNESHHSPAELYISIGEDSD